MKGKARKLKSIKIKNFCSAKNVIKRMKSYRLVEVFIGHTSKKKGLHPDYRKESQHSIVRKQMTQLKHGKRLERTVQKREYMDNHNYIHEKMFTV